MTHNPVRVEKVKQPPAEVERVFNSAEAVRAVPPQVRRDALARLAVLRRTLQQRTCSSTWQSDCWKSGSGFPPPADTTPMLPCRCEACARTGRLWPAYYSAPHSAPPLAASPAAGDEPPLPNGGINRILSYECYLESLGDWEAAQLPSSPSGLALRAVREGRIKLRRNRTRLGHRRHLS